MVRTVLMLIVATTVCEHADRDDPSKLHAYFSGTQGRHADIHSTLAGERFDEAREMFGWESFGAWGYKNLHVGMESIQPVRGTNWFRGALMRATWDSRRLWALIPSAGGDIPGQVRTVAQAGVLGKRLSVNLKVHNQTRSKTMGTLRAELLTCSGKTKMHGVKCETIPGFGLDDSIPLADDSYY
eukprot:COSAG02_NODE_21787_length_775_cov_0.760355_1_plen_183_part_10